MYIDVSLPVPLDQQFTYSLPLTLEHRAKPGCRILVPFGSRKLTGVVLAVHDTPPDAPVKEALRLLDEEPVLDAELLKLGRWISAYYCAPLGEVLRSMTPLAGEVRKIEAVFTHRCGPRCRASASAGRARRRPDAADAALLDGRPLSASYLKKKVPDAADGAAVAGEEGLRGSGGPRGRT